MQWLLKCIFHLKIRFVIGPVKDEKSSNCKKVQPKLVNSRSDRNRQFSISSLGLLSEKKFLPFPLKLRRTTLLIFRLVISNRKVYIIHGIVVRV